jgi:two-component system phosphate regulon response regulator PhoB/two-component system alkaline phosphatase synthesis response regulator PhoP
MANKILLIIEDDVLLGDAMLRCLQDEKYDVDLVRDGSKGLQKIRELKPNLVVLDSSLPKMSGLDILAAKFSDVSIANIPAIILMDSDDSSEISKVLALGAKDYLIKSQFNQESLVNKIIQQLSQFKQKSDETPKVTHSKHLLSGKKIMWVEDDAFLSEIIARKLSTEGCILMHATNGEEALPLVSREHPDVILLDIILPGMDGFEILRRIKDTPETKNIPVILLSNLGQKSDIEKGQQLGAERFLIKALVSLDEIIAEIETAIKKYAGKSRGE